MEPFEPHQEGLVTRVVLQGNQQQAQAENHPGQKPTRVVLSRRQAIAQAQGHQQVGGVVHEVIELHSVKRRGAVEAGQLAVDVVQQVPKLQQHRAGDPARMRSQGRE